MPRAARKKDVPTAGQLAMQIDAITAAKPAPAPPPPPPAAPPMQRSVYLDDHDAKAERQPFGGWLVKQQKGDNEWMAMLIGGAKADPRFPKTGDPDQVREHLGKQGADSDIFEAIDDAERAWRRS